MLECNIQIQVEDASDIADALEDIRGRVLMDKTSHSSINEDGGRYTFSIIDKS